MRNLPAALALSVIAHGAVLGWWVTRHHEPPPPDPERAADPEPITVDIVPLPPPPVPKLAAATPPPQPPPSMRHAPAEPGMARISVSATTSASPRAHAPESPAPPATPPPNGPHSPLLAMRDANPHLDNTGDVIESIAARPHAPETPTPPPPDGARTADDIDDDIKTTEQHLRDPDWVANATPDAVGDARKRLVALYDERDGHELQRDPHGGYTARHGGYTVHVDPDGTTHVSDAHNWQQHGLNATFDATDALMRHYHQDPYAANKLETLDRTRDERAAIAARYKREQLRHSKELVVAALGDVWKTTQDLHERKQLVFELWDDCAETGDPAVVEGGHEARAAVVAFIQVHFTGADAYTSGELHALNAHKTSHEPFAPYERE